MSQSFLFQRYLSNISIKFGFSSGSVFRFSFCFWTYHCCFFRYIRKPCSRLNVVCLLLIVIALIYIAQSGSLRETCRDSELLQKYHTRTVVLESFLIRVSLLQQFLLLTVLLTVYSYHLLLLHTHLQQGGTPVWSVN